MDKAKTKTAAPPGPSIPDSGYSLANPLSLVNLIRAGVPWSLYRGVVTNLGLTDQVAAGVLHIPPRTLARRKGGRLEPEEGERLMRLVRLVAQARGLKVKASVSISDCISGRNPATTNSP